MQVTDKMTLRKYDKFCRVHCPHKIPKWNSKIFEYRVGDCIYDYSQGEQPVLRPSVHGISNQETDLGGINVLMSRHFYYFGDKAVHLPASLTPLVHKNQGHKSTANQPYVIPF
jgi:Nucleotide modification associated domain 2